MDWVITEFKFFFDCVNCFKNVLWYLLIVCPKTYNVVNIALKKILHCGDIFQHSTNHSFNPSSTISLSNNKLKSKLQKNHLNHFIYNLL